MAEFLIKKGLSTNLFDVNKNLLITPEEGCWYLTTDTFELFTYFNGVFRAIGKFDDAEIQAALALKANSADVYDKNTIDSKFKDVNFAISNITHFTVEIVESTEQVVSDNVLYLIADNSVPGSDKYNEYLLIGGYPTLIGDTSTDLSGYVTTTRLQEHETAAEQRLIELTQAISKKADAADLAYYYTKPEADAITNALEEALKTKIDTAEIAHTNDSTAEGVLIDGTKMTIVVDAPTRAEVATAINGVANTLIGALDDYKAENDAKVVALGTQIVGLSDILAGFGGDNEPKQVKEYIDANKFVLNVATETTLGGIKSTNSNEDNAVHVTEDGTAIVNKVNISTLVQTEGDHLILDGGNA